MSNKDDEQVLVMPADKRGDLETLLRMSPSSVSLLDFKFARRGDVETDFSWLQLIPYLVVPGPKGPQDGVWGYCRTTESGEERLRGKVSIGFGGHINPEDARYLPPEGDAPARVDLGMTMGAAALRELREELQGPGLASAKILLAPVLPLYSDADDVSRVHLGVLCVVLPGEDLFLTSGFPEVAPADPTSTACRLYSLEELERVSAEEEGAMEIWSQQVCHRILR